MNALPVALRKRLERAIADAREVAEAGARAALETLAVHLREPYGHMSSEERTLRRRLRAHGRQRGDRLNARSGAQSIDRLLHECAYEQWHSMLFARFLAENHLLMEPESGVAVTLDECEELGKDEDLDRWGMAARFAHRMLPQVFRPAHPAFEIRFAREHQLKLEALLESLPAEIFVASDALGWVYQFWQSRRKDEVNRSGVKIGADELPAVTQLFTEPYMVSFLLDNTLGAWWAARRLTDDDLSVASSEAELRRKAAIPGVPLDYLRFVRIPLRSSAGVCAPPSSSERSDPAALHGGDTRPEDARVPPSPSGRGAGGEGGKPPLPPHILKHARTLRSKQTDAEQLLWGLLRNRHFAGKKFRRQHPIDRYILDFYCHECRLAVELDGGQHNDEETRSRDERRSRFLREQGVRVVRFWNHDVLLQTESVLESLWDEVHGDVGISLPSPQTPLPVGEGLLSKHEGVAPIGQRLGPAGLRAGIDDFQHSSDQGPRGAISPNHPAKERSTETEEPFTWTLAGGEFSNWPDDLAEFRLLDPCCGSGHFLVAAFSMLVPMRMELEGLSTPEAVDAVLRENLHGLELDPRCVEVAAFALALAAWTCPDAEGYRPLPEINLACSGLAPNATKEQWTALAEQAAAAGGLAPDRNLFDVDDTLLSAPLRNSMEALYELFSQAPVLGSLIDPHAVDADLFRRDFESSRELFAVVLKQERTSDEEFERAVAARGMARAAQLLADRYTLVITNVPYLLHRKQHGALRAFCQRYYPNAKSDLATVLLERCLRLCAEYGNTCLVLPQNWLFLTTYRKLRERLLRSETWQFLVRLGPGAFETISGEVVKAILLSLSRSHPTIRLAAISSYDGPPEVICGLDVSESRTPKDKAVQMKVADISVFEQAQQLKNPDARVVLGEMIGYKSLATFARSVQGVTSGDNPRFIQKHWEHFVDGSDWTYLQSACEGGKTDYGAHSALFWESGQGEIVRILGEGIKGRPVWGRRGVTVGQMSSLPATEYIGHPFDMSCAAIIPFLPSNLLPIYAFCTSQEFMHTVRRIDQKLNVTTATLGKVPFNLDQWTTMANPHFSPRGH